MPEVNIGTDGVLAVLPEDLIATYPQIPVLLIATVTSPGFKLSPFWTLSRDGVASATHSSCCGFVYTPILAFEGFSIADLGISVAEGAITALVLISLSSLRDKLQCNVSLAGILSNDLFNRGMREQ